MINIAILASGNGSNFEAIAKAVKSKKLKGVKIKLLITDKKGSFVRKRASRFNIPDIFINPKSYKSRASFDKAIIKILEKEKIQLVVLAGYMRILSPYFVKTYKNKIINIHPALLPSFKGTGSIKRAYDYGCKITGITVHFVDENVDHGPIILQEAVEIKKGLKLSTLEAKIHKIEHKLYPQAINLFAQKKLKVKKRHVKVG